jgi:hypothetical protein
VQRTTVGIAQDRAKKSPQHAPYPVSPSGARSCCCESCYSIKHHLSKSEGLLSLMLAVMLEEDQCLTEALTYEIYYERLKCAQIWASKQTRFDKHIFHSSSILSKHSGLMPKPIPSAYGIVRNGRVRHLLSCAHHLSTTTKHLHFPTRF